MPHVTKYDPVQGIIETKHQGSVTVDEARTATAEKLQLTVETGCFRWLSDFSGIPTQLPYLDAFTLHGFLLDAGRKLGIDAYRIKRAVVVDGPREDHKFTETVEVNRGLKTRVFENRDEAIDWLLE